ncbi:MAG TPA: prepilin-type N-terminal cleavage/methylation domain-containing protein [Sandaracinaceae bacterium LLY-WYZ-13_1]|nr:prepilin-type N-terminal cleavage/methylation domain-containing protein [Sandaracinaceae bacterium LLY-WYZ-13_1]
MGGLGGKKLFGAFTLLEVMVAVAILGIALTAIFSSEAGAIRAGARARHMTTATLLARCKMGEVEEQLMREGFPAVGMDGTDECCEGGEQEGFSCDWAVERIELPDQMGGMGEEGGGDPLGLGGDHAADSASTEDLSAALGGAAGGDVLGAYAVQYAWPVLRPGIEEQVRRVLVTVTWHEGEEERSFDVVQYVVADQGVFVPGQGNEDPQNGASGGGQNQPGQQPNQQQRRAPTQRINLPGGGGL